MIATSAAMLAVLLSLSLPLGPTTGAVLAMGVLWYGAPMEAPVPVAVTAPSVVSVCKDGATRKADDGCNTCSCHNGQWACTEKACSRKTRP